MYKKYRAVQRRSGYLVDYFSKRLAITEVNYFGIWLTTPNSVRMYVYMLNLVRRL